MMSKVAIAYQANNSWFKITLFIGCALLAAYLLFSGDSLDGSSNSLRSSNVKKSRPNQIHVATWNIAAINNNPFEYWITNDDPSYNDIMKKVSLFIDSTGGSDVNVSVVFTDAMAKELFAKMEDVGWKGVAETKAIWNNDYKNRKIISQFIKDGSLGKKRLASMPDRITNTINLSPSGFAMRPTVINCFSGDLSTPALWWKQWSSFFFENSISLNKKGEQVSSKVYQMISKISKSSKMLL
jgi:hypothetical protein